MSLSKSCVRKPTHITSFPGTGRVAIPIFMGRVSPVLDTCEQLFVVESNGKKHAPYRTVTMEGLSIYKRACKIEELGIRFIICGAVSEFFSNILREKGINLCSGISGDITEVIEAYRNGNLDQPQFRMPGSD